MNKVEKAWKKYLDKRRPWLKIYVADFIDPTGAEERFQKRYKQMYDRFLKEYKKGGKK